ncbi:calcium-binding protein 7 [Rhinatrema bivittatum]|uniref:calcium-binding protein 7 n=1 Tax=Rhinatrema bivittatum TaxID=194408 RepID=UPI001128E10D|nr:calcium-binding protein 7 [Rhinatrema bivittatum]
MWERQDPLLQNLQEFVLNFRLPFDDPARQTTATSELLHLRQGTRSMADYTIDFRTLAMEVGWRDDCLRGIFLEGLASRIKDELAGRDLPDDLNDLIDIAGRVDRRLQQREKENRSVRRTPPPTPSSAWLPSPRQLSLFQFFFLPTEIREAFKVFDRDGNGFISKQELGTAMRSLGYMPNEVELEVIIQRLDMDGDGQVDFEEFVTLLGPKITTSGMPDKFHGTDFDTVFWKCDMQKLTVDELKRLLYDTFCEHLSMKDIENIIMTEEESNLENAEECPVDVETSPNQQIRQTCVRKSLICAFAIAFIISVMLIAANQVLRSGMK